MIDIPKRDTQADRDFSKLTFKLSKHKLKKVKKYDESSKFSTLHEAVNGNIQSFQEKKMKLEKGAKTKKLEEKINQIEEDEINYLLDTIPFIKEYDVKETVKETV